VQLRPMDEKSYTNVSANTDVWLDGDFIPAIASLVCHNNHSLVPTALMGSGKDVPQLTHVTYPNSHMRLLMTTRHFQAASNA
jgi:hypothetical protein